MLQTKRLTILPLTYEQLMKYAKCDNSLEEELQLNTSSRRISPELKEAIEETLLPKLALKSTNYVYSTLWTAISREHNTMVGDLCIVDEPSVDGEIEIGYGTYEEFQGMGYMTEILAAIILWARSRDHIKSIIATTDKTNIASIKVLQKNNFMITDENDASFFWKLVLI